MIKLTRLDGREFIVNAELIETFEATPETVVTLSINKKRMVVRESVEEVWQKVIEYKRLILSDWPIKKHVRIPSNEDSFSWIEADGILPIEDADAEVLKEFPHLNE